MLKGKISVVIGGAKGIGKGIVQELARQGSNVAFLDLDLEAGRRLKEETELLYGVDIFFFNGDTCMQDDLETFANAVIGQYGKVDFVINNGCAEGSSLIAPINGEEFGDELKKNLAVPYVLAKMFRDYFGVGGCIINVLNAREAENAEQHMMLQSVREATVSLSRRMARLYEGVVRINCVSPRKKICESLEKEMVATPFDVIKTVSFLCQEKADFINGENLVVDGTLTKMVVCHGEGGWSFRKK